MVRYRRWYIDDSEMLYFITYVTKDRKNIFNTREDFLIQWQCWKEVLVKMNGNLFAWVFLPNHSHIILKQGDQRFSETMRTFKRRVSWMMKAKGGI